MYYCGVCKSIGRQYGHIKRFGLVNEMGMLALLLDCISGNSENTAYNVKPCIAHPFRKSPAVTDSVYTDYGADVNVMFAYFKLIDSWHDDRKFFSAVGAEIGFRRAAVKAGRRNPSVYASMRENINGLNRAEKCRTASLDEVSHFFSSLMRDVFTEAPGIRECLKSDSEYDTEEKLVSLKNLGYYIGKWIYLIDALYDLEEDIKHNHYNPILLRFHYDRTETVATFKSRIQSELAFVMHDALGHCTRAWHILSEDLPDTPRVRDAKGFMENVLYLGMRAKTRKGFISDEPI
jgi:hypothetical protein